MCYDRAHQLGSLHGTSNFVRALRKGDGISRNYELAFHLAREAAEKGHPTACYQAGEMALKGLGTQLDYQKARNLFEKGAAQGNKECIYMLGGNTPKRLWNGTRHRKKQRAFPKGNA